MELFLQTLLNGLLMAGVYALVATGLALSLGVVGIVKLCPRGVPDGGGLLSYLLYAARGVDPLLALGLAFLAAFLVGALTYWGLIRPVLKAPELNQMLLTFGLSILLQNLALLLFGGRHPGGGPALPGGDPGPGAFLPGGGAPGGLPPLFGLAPSPPGLPHPDPLGPGHAGGGPETAWPPGFWALRRRGSIFWPSAWRRPWPGWRG
jgi:hypothetical protein